LPDRARLQELRRRPTVARVSGAVVIDADSAVSRGHEPHPVNNHLPHVWLILWLSAREGRVALDGVDRRSVANVNRRRLLPRTDSIARGRRRVNHALSALAEECLNCLHFGVGRAVYLQSALVVIIHCSLLIRTTVSVRLAPVRSAPSTTACATASRRLSAVSLV